MFPSKRKVYCLAPLPLILFVTFTAAAILLTYPQVEIEETVVEVDHGPFLPNVEPWVTVCLNENTVNIREDVLEWYLNHDACLCDCPCRECTLDMQYVCPEKYKMIFEDMEPVCIDEARLAPLE